MTTRRKRNVQAQELRAQLHGSLGKLKEATASLTPVREAVRAAADTGDFEPITDITDLPRLAHG